MDFSYQYTPEQEDFRLSVCQWLEENVPASVDALFESSEGADALVHISELLGHMGWLAPNEPTERGGAGLTPDQTVVSLEELNRRGLLPLVMSDAQGLRTALAHWRGEAKWGSVGKLLSSGELTVWRHQVSLSPRMGGPSALDYDSVGLTAGPDADGYIVNGTALLSGFDNTPGILWTVALVESEDNDPLPVCLLIDASSVGIKISSSKTLSGRALKQVEFRDVWALRTDALGPEGDGHRVINTQVSLDPNADLPGWVETETDALLDYARRTESGGKPLSADPIRARILVEAYIASRVSRLLRMRSAWVQSQGGQVVVSEALDSLWRRAAGSELSDTTRQVIGPRALLSSDDPQAAVAGRFERLSRRELAERESGSAGDPEREALASELGVGDPKPER